jgi:hypothetical protein
VIGVGAAASVQFGGGRKLVLRVVAVDTRPAYYGFAWVTGYVVDREGEAIDKREIYVQVAGLVLSQDAPSRSKWFSRTGYWIVRSLPEISAGLSEIFLAAGIDVW